MNTATIRENLCSFTSGQRGCTLLVFNGFNYVRNRKSGLKTYWICAKKGSTKCNARVVTDVIDGVQKIVLESCRHNHAQMVARKKRNSSNAVDSSNNMVSKIKARSSRYNRKSQTNSELGIENVENAAISLQLKPEMDLKTMEIDTSNLEFNF